MGQYSDCRHAVSEIRWRNRRIGMLGRQCLDCGDAVSTNWIPHNDAVRDLNLRNREQLQSLPDWADLPEPDNNTLDLFGLGEPRPERKIDRTEYAEYLASDDWKRRRLLILKRAGGTCEGCLVKQGSLDVHHKTYKHFKQEFAFELIALCRECHERVHGRTAA